MPNTTSDTSRVAAPGDWTLRRIVIFGSLAACGLGVGYALMVPGDAVTQPGHIQIAVELIHAAMAIIGYYVFGAVLDDHNARKALQAQGDSQ